MSHFPPGHWIDFARGILPVVQTAQIEDHLARGCDECLKTSELWRLVADLSAAEASYAPPAPAIRIAKAAYASAKPERWLPQVAQFARLLFDSFRQPATATVRASMQAARQIVHESEPFTIDLRLESDRLRQRTFLAGQILNSENPNEPVAEVEVVLLSAERLITRATANGEGEFELEFPPAPDLQLFINIRGQRAIGVVLPEDV